MTENRPPTPETTARSTTPPPAAEPNLLLQRGRDEIELYSDGRAVQRELAWVKSYPQVVRALLKQAREEKHRTALLRALGALNAIMDFAKVENDRLIIPLSAERISEELGIGEATVKRWFRVLSTYSLIHHERARGDDDGPSSRYKHGLWVVHPSAGLARFGVNLALTVPAAQLDSPPDQIDPVEIPALRIVPDPVEEIACSAPRDQIDPVDGEGQLSLDQFSSGADAIPSTALLESSCSDHRISSSPEEDRSAAQMIPLKQEVVVAPSDEDNNSVGTELAVQALCGRDVFRSVAEKLVRDYGVERCLQQAEWIDFRNPKNRAKLLVRAIQENYDEPEEMTRARAEAEAEARRRELEQEREAAEAAEIRRREQIDALIDAMSAEERAAREQKIIDETLGGDGAMAARLRDKPGVVQAIVRDGLRKMIARELDAES